MHCEEFLNNWKDNTVSISSLVDQIKKDIFNAKGISSVIDSIIDKTKEDLNKTIQKIEKSIEKRLAVVQVDK